MRVFLIVFFLAILDIIRKMIYNNVEDYDADFSV